jgi:hypothetical protein
MTVNMIFDRVAMTVVTVTIIEAILGEGGEEMELAINATSP